MKVHILAWVGCSWLSTGHSLRTTTDEVSVGIDVGKTWRYGCRGQDAVWQVANEDPGVSEISAWMATMEPQRTAIKATAVVSKS